MSARDEWDAMMAWIRDSGAAHASLALDQLTRLEMTREALIDQTAEVNELREQVRTHREMLQSIGIVLDVAGRAARMESTAHDLIEATVDTAPFRNLMSTMYGLGPMGEPAKPKKRRAA